ncbi:Sec-independent protein translocase subunit TatA [Actinomycetospora lutea]|uniref:Sec-independent protein translocase subunit TatA n=1 Tax=Actinomycetospora lutea TaxID=663604 RepID=UPI0023664930|nr:Sec-independent protein translocase subunit TatA [Actinomycetospora lutea]MDD7937372.1 Sec-independent protein translocase subunit TatA [Actinomycetospora lutea]
MSEWVIVAIVGVVLLFSARKLPDMARGLGQSMRIFKAETRGLREDEKAEKGTANDTAAPQAPGRALDEAPSNGTTPAPQDTPAPRPGSTSS